MRFDAVYGTLSAESASCREFPQLCVDVSPENLAARPLCPIHRLPADETAAGGVLCNEITDARADIDRAFDDQISAVGAISDDHRPEEAYL
jgi:hypothetical protein